MNGTYERRAVSEDSAFLRNLFASSLPTLPGVSVEQTRSFTEMQFLGREHTYSSHYSDALDCILCLGDGTAVGRVLTVRRQTEIRVIDIAVSPEHRKQGIATSALRRLQSQAALEGIEVRLSVAISNSALSLYKRLGFRIVKQGPISLEMGWQLPGVDVGAAKEDIASATKLPLPSQVVVHTGQVLDRNTVITAILGFIQEIGLRLELSELTHKTFLPGLELMSGGLRVDPARLKYPGDLLHEAGHLAVMPPERRLCPTPEPTSDGAEEMAAIAWSYAAAVHLGLPPALVLHEEGYRGQAKSLLSGFESDFRPGLPLLQWMGLCRSSSEGQGLAFPMMLRWLRETAVPMTEAGDRVAS